MIKLAALFLSLAVSLLLPTPLWTQPNDPDVVTVEDEIESYYGLGAGYMRMLTFVDYEEFNKVNDDLGLPHFSGPFNTDIVGVLFSPRIITANLRIGLYLGTGSKQVSKSVTLQDGQQYTRTIYFTTVLGGVLADYAIPITSSFTIFPGLLFGAGRYTYGGAQIRSSGDEFRNIFGSAVFNGDTTSKLNRFGRVLRYPLFLYPAVNMEYTVSPNIMLRAGAGYSTGLGLTKWVDEGGTELANTPDFNVRGLSVQLGLYLGLFSY